MHYCSLRKAYVYNIGRRPSIPTTYRFKFFCNGTWVCDGMMPIETDINGQSLNVVSVQPVRRHTFSGVSKRPGAAKIRHRKGSSRNICFVLFFCEFNDSFLQKATFRAEFTRIIPEPVAERCFSRKSWVSTVATRFCRENGFPGDYYEPARAGDGSPQHVSKRAEDLRKAPQLN